MNNTENYKELLNTIFNSDESEKIVKSVICVYDTFEEDRLVAVFSKSEACGNFFRTTRRVIDCDICRGKLKANRYRLERVKLEEEWKKNY